MASETTGSSFNSTKTTSFRSSTSGYTTESSSNDVVLQHLPCANRTSPTTTHFTSFKCVATLSGSRDPKHMISCLAVHGTLLYAASGGRIDVYDLLSFCHVDVLNGGDGLVKAIAFDEESGRVFTAHQDRRIRVWRLTRTRRHRLVTSLPTLTDRLRRFAFPKNYVVVRRHKRRLWIQHNDAVSGLAVNKGLLYSISWDRSLKVWQTVGSKCIESAADAHSDAINAVAVSAAGDAAVYTASADGTIKAWKRQHDGQSSTHHSPVALLTRDGSAFNALALARDGHTLLSGSCEGEVVAWGKEKGEGPDQMRLRAVLAGHEGAVLCLVAVDFGMFASGSADRTVRIWGECGDGKGSGFCCLGVLEGHRKPVRSLVALGRGVEEGDEGNGAVLMGSGSLDGEVKIWKVVVNDEEVCIM